MQEKMEWGEKQTIAILLNELSFFWIDFIDLNSQLFRDVAQPGSAPRSGRGGRWFESSHPDFFRSVI